MLAGSLLLVFKAAITTALVVLAAVISRRWGEYAGGLVAGLPLTSGPISAFLLVQHGAQFARVAAIGTLLGTTGVVLFSVAYARQCRRGWVFALSVGLLAYALSGMIFLRAPRSLGLTALLAGALWLIGGLFLPETIPASREKALPAWDIPVRALISTILVVLLTALASALGPSLTGFISPFPIVAILVLVFAHIHYGSAAALKACWGICNGTLAFILFFLTIAVAVESLGLFVYLLATAAALVAGALIIYLPRTSGYVLVRLAQARGRAA